ncbi:MAG: hypothetical protein GC205_06680 [Bacteroidetes bacterium]|nr:hypothetical protein [Bacteroidota bacterium]
MFSALRNTLFRYAVGRRLMEKSITRNTVPFSEARHIGILVRLQNEEDHLAAQQYADQLRAAGKKVDVLAYLDRKKVTPAESIQTLQRSDCNWLGFPSGESARYFEQQPFDVLICAWLGRCLPLRYLALFSQASWRIGEFTRDKEPSAEFLINLPNEQHSLAEFFAEVDHYLQSIRTHETES